MCVTPLECGYLSVRLLQNRCREKFDLEDLTGIEKMSGPLNCLK